MALSDEEWAAYQAELVDKANVYADVWSRLGEASHAGTAAHILVAARAYASMEEPLDLEQFLALCRGMYKMAEAETRDGELVAVAARPAEIPPLLN